MFKKILSLTLNLVMVLLLSSCSINHPEPKITEPVSEIMVLTSALTTLETTVTSPSPTAEQLALLEYLKENFNKIKIDGSTTMLPLHNSLIKNFAVNKNAEAYHRRTVRAFEDLIGGETDILLGVDYSEEFLNKAKESGIDLVKLPITREAFVFLINSKNPVKNLTTEQIKDIYSGKITNWKEIGGDDAPINAFQRNFDSGSQMRMVMFMDDVPLIRAKAEYIYEGMKDITEIIAAYDSGENSIAYNMYTFTEKQYIVNGVELLSVDGVSPTDETIYSNKYPIITYNYIWYDRNNKKATEFAENLYIYLMSDEGQKILADAGYVNLNTGYDRNKNIDVPREGEEAQWLPFYNPDKGEFYSVDDNGNLIIHYNYPDYVLCNSKYMDNANAREFLERLFNSKIPIDSLTLNNDSTFENGIFCPNLFIDGELDLMDFIQYRYEGRYFAEMSYDVEKDTYFLSTFWLNDEKFMEKYISNYPEYFEDYELATIEIKKEDLENLFVYDFWSYDGDYADDDRYYQPFKAE